MFALITLQLFFPRRLGPEREPDSYNSISIGPVPQIETQFRRGERIPWGARLLLGWLLHRSRWQSHLVPEVLNRRQ